MASPNPETNESLNETENIETTADNQQTNANRQTRPLDAHPDQRDANQTDNLCCTAKEQFGKTKIVLNILLTVGTLGAFAAASIYAYHAKHQTHWAHVTAQQAINANAVAHQNAMQEIASVCNSRYPAGQTASRVAEPER